MSVGLFRSDTTTAYTPPSTKFAAEGFSSALIQTAVSIASVRAARAQSDTERREALAEIDGYIAQVER